MTRRAAIIGTAALPVGKYQTGPDSHDQVVEHELLARLVVAAMADAQADRADIASIVVA